MNRCRSTEFLEKNPYGKYGARPPFQFFKLSVCAVIAFSNGQLVFSLSIYGFIAGLSCTAILISHTINGIKSTDFYFVSKVLMSLKY